MKALLDSATPLLIAFLIQSIILSAAILLAARLSRGRGPAFQVAIHRAGPVAILALLVAGPVLSRAVHPWWVVSETPVVAPGAPHDSLVRNLVTSRTETAQVDSRSPHVSDYGLDEPLGSEASTTPASWITLVWLIGSLLLIGLTGGGAMWVRRLRKGGPGSGSPGLAQTLARIAAQQGVIAPNIVASARVQNAFAAGVYRSDIYVPVDIESRFEQNQVESILCHELMHVMQRDAPWTLLARLSCAICWPNPFVWLTAAGMVRSQEELCDQLVLRTGVAPPAYAGCLLRVAASFLSKPPERLVAAGVYSSKSHLSRRISLMLKAPSAGATFVNRRARILIASLLVAGVFGTCLLASARGAHDPTPEATVRGLFDALSQRDWNSVFSRIQDAKVERATKVMSHQTYSPRDESQASVAILSAKTTADDSTLHVRIETVNVRIDPKNANGTLAPVEDDVHLHRVGGDWKIVDGGGPNSLITRIAQAAREPEKVMLASEKVLVLSNLKQIGLALIMYAGSQGDRFSLTQSNLKAKLEPFLKGNHFWLAPDGQPLDVRVNPAVLGKSDNVTPAYLIMLSVGPRDNLRFFGDRTPVVYCDGHAAFLTKSDADQATWSAH